MVQQTTFDFQDGKGQVPTHRHSSGGGWAANTAEVADTAFVDLGAKVYGNTEVSGHAQTSGFTTFTGMLTEGAIDSNVYGPYESRARRTCWTKAEIEESRRITREINLFADS